MMYGPPSERGQNNHRAGHYVQEPFYGVKTKDINFRVEKIPSQERILLQKFAKI